MTPKNERQFLALSLRIKHRASGITNPSVRDMTSLSNVAEANVTPLWESFGNEQSLTAQQVEGLHTFNVLIADRSPICCGKVAWATEHDGQS